MPRRLTIGVALSAGGAAAIAEVGVLAELTAAGIPIDRVAGTSAGAMVGAAYAAGRLPEFSATMRGLTRRRVLSLFDPTWPRVGLLEGRRAMELIRPHVGSSIESLLRPFAAIATDLRTGEEVVIREGSVIDAIRASVAIPGIFTPQRRDGRLLVDGGLVNPVPVSATRAIGAEFVIAVSVLPRPDERLPPRRPRKRLGAELVARLFAGWNGGRASDVVAEAVEETASVDEEIGLIEVMLDASRIVERRIADARFKEEPPDFLLEVPLPRTGIFDFQLSGEMIAAGREAAKQALPELGAALAGALPLYRRFTRWRDGRKRAAGSS